MISRVAELRLTSHYIHSHNRNRNQSCHCHKAAPLFSVDDGGGGSGIVEKHDIHTQNLGGIMKFVPQFAASGHLIKRLNIAD